MDARLNLKRILKNLSKTGHWGWRLKGCKIKLFILKEIREIIKAYDAVLQAGRKAALATVVHLDGSSYRQPGARMLVRDDGELTGAISGGCLEGDALRKAMLVLSQDQSKLVTYDTSDEEDAAIGLQLGCAGVIRVLFEPIDPQNPHNPVQLLK
jgi:xanthine dehydrogenase accessory factor